MPSPLFAATLTPHRSLTPRGRRILIATIAIAASIPGLTMYALGAWPVVGFMGLDVAAVWWALNASTRSGQRSEHVALYPDSLDVRLVSDAGAERLLHFNPFFVRLEISRDAAGRISGLALRDRAQTLPIGSFLNEPDKTTFAKALGAALARARR
jgi:uncharacterized membrane protein